MGTRALGETETTRSVGRVARFSSLGRIRVLARPRSGVLVGRAPVPPRRAYGRARPLRAPGGRKCGVAAVPNVAPASRFVPSCPGLFSLRLNQSTFGAIACHIKSLAMRFETCEIARVIVLPPAKARTETERRSLIGREPNARGAQRREPRAVAGGKRLTASSRSARGRTWATSRHEARAAWPVRLRRLGPRLPRDRWRVASRRVHPARA